MTKSGIDEQLTAQIPPKPQDFRLSARNHGISCQQRILHTGATSMISVACSEIKETAESIRLASRWGALVGWNPGWLRPFSPMRQLAKYFMRLKLYETKSPIG
jgi:hypothetical protein